MNYFNIQEKFARLLLWKFTDYEEWLTDYEKQKWTCFEIDVT